jgi:hypothetical protein
MSLTLLLVGGIAVFFTAACVVAARPDAQPATAGENTVVGLADPAAETVIGDRVIPGPVGVEWQMSAVDDLTQAEDLLDCLEARGFEHRELVVLGNSSFAVRWR